ncbi:hypothetical protein [uncultured Psychrobacter sp.]|uniref:hypothetical protein n=1 Tax=uncultured Psychrobacter sp. TaxID=259303 RepID=UPI0034579FA0
MTTISPTRVSMYDFLYQDTQPMVSLLADTAKLSLPQVQLALGSSLQAIVTALLAYQERNQASAVNKKLFSRSAVKELRKYNSMNFATIDATLYYRNDVAEVVFGNTTRITKASEYIATQIQATTSQVQTLLACLCIIVLRELAILVDYSKLDNEEVEKWFDLQPQFLSKQRFAVSLPDDSTALVTDLATTPPVFDPYWYKLMNFEPKLGTQTQDMQQATPNYLKAIGRVGDTSPEGQHDDMLVFAQMPAIALPHQRWLLQLAKICDIYLSRKRLRITSEPLEAPTRPLVSLGFMDTNKDNTPTTTSEKPIEYDKPRPLWKDPALVLTILVIAVLGALALLKYQIKQSNSVVPTTEAVLEQKASEQRVQQDVAIVKIDEENSATNGH